MRDIAQLQVCKVDVDDMGQKAGLAYRNEFTKVPGRLQSVSLDKKDRAITELQVCKVDVVDKGQKAC